MPTSRPLEDRFWEKVDKREPGECWVWLACTVKGYGQIWQSGRQLKAHRVSWELHHGPIPDGMLVCHTCDNKPCVNPAHLFLGTHSDNMKDAARKGHILPPPIRRGKSNGNAKLNDRQALDIYSRIQNGETKSALAREFGISPKAVYSIGAGLAWSWLTGHHPKPQSNPGPPPSQ